ncbi:MAG: hypothetical protein E7345_01690 [Clostridiales bacterium]|nr:hypothetical protein [Clostridiales bacterium]
MSAFGKVAYTENDNIAKETTSENFSNQSVIEEQVEKFDNNYSVKLQELYNEYDKVALNEDRLKEVTQIKVNAVSKKVPFKLALVMTTSIIITLLLAFLCIYNITVINGMASDISYTREEVTRYEYDLSQAQALYGDLTSTEGIKSELAEKGYESVTSSNIVAIDVADSVEVTDLQADTNWFDAVCNFVSQIFG